VFGLIGRVRQAAHAQEAGEDKSEKK
jgi:hypothetical protein